MDAGRLTQKKLNDMINANSSIVIAATYNILFTNDIVIGLIKDAGEQIRKCDKYKFETKKYLKYVEKAVNDYEVLTNNIIGPRCDFMADANTVVSEELYRDINRLTYSIKRQFEKANLSNTYMLAKAETARTLCEFGCVQLDDRIKELERTDKSFAHINISYLRQTDICNGLNSLMRTFKIPLTVDLNTEECRSMLNVVTKKLADCEMIAKAIKLNEE